ncbi:hypothetical protein [Lactiplantibacillus plantarum]|uniref:DUF1659 domain-containing protein n=1 Tax=Lactiplantibacillus plantarum TaxID=1590 RepID=UPI0007EBD4DF|nr:hypothetical protein [Lactiplantibacillus plantarum]OAZ75662.1 hypothetical protein SRCM101060_00954 [Lactiplantibacillus plantarum]PKX57915.1 hypothetical protein CUR48_12815 [Lactiplantibacillus plantarum]
MTKTLLKATLTVQTTTELDEQRKQTFNAIAQDATDEQLAAFGKIVEVLTGDQFTAANLANAYRYDPQPIA